MHKPLSSFGLPGTGERVVRFKNIAEAIIAAHVAHEHGFPVIPLGTGTNCVFLEPKISAIFLQSRDRSLSMKQSGSKILVTAGAGLPWDDLVRFAVRHNLQGLEYLSGIPGTCGAAPVQNIAAYGAELAETFRRVEVLNLKTLRVQKLPREACHFGYRQSIFNTTEHGRFLITSLTLALAPNRTASPPKYPELAQQLAEYPTLTDVRRIVLNIRRKKLPDYHATPNCGSFFKNPIVNKAIAAKIAKKYLTLPYWPEPNGKVKISAAWLIGHAGVRGRHWGKISISPQHALVLVNNGESNYAHLQRAIQEITSVVQKTFGITIKTEPNFFDKNITDTFWTRQKQ